MGELEFQRKLAEGSGSTIIGERERAEGESAGDSDPSDNDDQEQDASDSEEEDNEAKGLWTYTVVNNSEKYTTQTLIFFVGIHGEGN